ncbi:MAG: Short-chain type dehydrogenase/reductase (EC, partial [uncultured Craurococcus sp.]
EQHPEPEGRDRDRGLGRHRLGRGGAAGARRVRRGRPLRRQRRRRRGRGPRDRGGGRPCRERARRRVGRRRGGPHVRRGRGGVRRGGRPGQHRRHNGPGDGGGERRPPVRPDGRHQPEGHLQRTARSGAAAARRRPDRELLVQRHGAADADLRRLRRHQGRGGGPDGRAGQGDAGSRHHGQRRRARPRGDQAVPRRQAAGGSRRHGQGRAAGAPGPAGGHRRRGRLPGRAGRRLGQRPDAPRQRRDHL